MYTKPIKTTRYGYRFSEPTHYNSFHLGLDLMAKTGTPIFAPDDGEVVWIGYGKQGGKQMHFLGVSGALHRFLHLDSYAGVHRGQKLLEGEIVAISGNTGALSTIEHLHFDISKNGKLELDNLDNFIDPLEWLKQNKMKTWYTGIYDEFGWNKDKEFWNPAREHDIEKDPYNEGRNFAKAVKTVLLKEYKKKVENIANELKEL